MNRRWWAGLVVAGMVASACSSESHDTTAPPETTAAEQAPASSATSAATTAATAATTSTAGGDGAPIGVDGDDVRLLELGPMESTASVTIDIGPGDRSFLFHAVASGSEDFIGVVEVVGPDGTVLSRDLGFALDEAYGAFGEVAFLYPITEDSPLLEGRYLLTAATEGAAIVDSHVVIRSGDVDGPQALDAVFWMVTASPELANELTRAELATEWRRTGDEILAPFDLLIGDMEFVDAPPEVVDSFAQLPLPSDDPTDSAQKELCRAMEAALGSGRAINFAVVDQIVDPEGEGVTEGNAPALPGTVLVPGSSVSCVVVMAGPDPFEPDRDVFDRAVVAWHEAGHLLGLFHTTEADGQVFDLFADTPECDAAEFDTDDDGLVTEFECPDGDNFMFHDTDRLVMSADQAWMIRRHPAFYPAG